MTESYKVWHGFLQHLPRYTRYTLGTKIDNLFIETLELILLAGYSSKDQKILIVRKASSKLDALKFFIQVAWELKALEDKQYLSVSMPVAEIGKMLGGWSRQLVKETPLQRGE